MTKHGNWNLLICVGAIVCGLAVVLGAFGAHALEGYLQSSNAEDMHEDLNSWETGVRYQFFHGLAFLVLASFADRVARPGFIKWTTILFVAGIVIFSGGLYAWVLTDIKPFVRVVPLGGVAFIAGWIVLACAPFCGPDELTADSG